MNILDARVHCAVLKLRTNPPTRPAYPHHTVARAVRRHPATRTEANPNLAAGCLRTQQCVHEPPPPAPGRSNRREHRRTRPEPQTGGSTVNVPPRAPPPAHSAGAWSTMNPHHQETPATGVGELLRKEVIQPHLPVRLPCYDLVPIASPTFDHSPPNGLGHGLRVLPTFVT